MAQVADYGIVQVAFFSIGSKAGQQSKTIFKSLPSNLNRGSRSVLSYVIRHVDVGDVFKVDVKINGVVVDRLSYDDVQFGLDRTIQKVVKGNLLQVQANDFTFEVKSEVSPGGKITFSDVVIHVQVNV